MALGRGGGRCSPCRTVADCERNELVASFSWFIRGTLISRPLVFVASKTIGLFIAIASLSSLRACSFLKFSLVPMALMFLESPVFLYV
uniref:7TM_GPCR_Srx domain-containing protein n=1 Tax=Steinernema glaseri TaxID=37863 RepID=A0A1I7Y1P3_9BILA